MAVSWDIPLTVSPEKKAELERNQLLLDWETAKSLLETAKNNEMDLRKKVAASYFPTPNAGTQRVPLANDYKLKLVHKLNYKLSDVDSVDNALDKIEKLGNEGPFIAERLIKWTASLGKAEYDTLIEDAAQSAVHMQMLQALEEVLTIEPGAPTLEIEAPKVKK